MNTEQIMELGIASQCRATATSPISANILVDGGSGTLRDLLTDAANAIEQLVQELDDMAARRNSWVAENAPGGWIDNLRNERDALKANLHQVSLSHTHLHTENKVLRDALNNCEDALRNSQTVLGQPSSGFVRVCVDANDLALSIANAALQGRKA